MKTIEGWATVSSGQICAIEIEDGTKFPLGIFPTESEAREYFGKDAELVQVSTTVKGAE